MATNTNLLTVGSWCFEPMNLYMLSFRLTSTDIRRLISLRQLLYWFPCVHQPFFISESGQNTLLSQSPSSQFSHYEAKANTGTAAFVNLYRPFIQLELLSCQHSCLSFISACRFQFCDRTTLRSSPQIPNISTSFVLYISSPSMLVVFPFPEQTWRHHNKTHANLTPPCNHDNSHAPCRHTKSSSPNSCGAEETQRYTCL